jgi:hypothetical protein
MCGICLFGNPRLYACLHYVFLYLIGHYERVFQWQKFFQPRNTDSHQELVGSSVGQEAYRRDRQSRHRLCPADSRGPSMYVDYGH